MSDTIFAKYAYEYIFNLRVNSCLLYTLSKCVYMCEREKEKERERGREEREREREKERERERKREKGVKIYIDFEHA